MCKNKTFLLFFAVIFILMNTSVMLRAQSPYINDTLHPMNFSGNQLFPALSTDGDIVFQSENSGNTHIYLFNPATDSTVQLTTGRINGQHPVWVPKKNAVVYDTGYGKESRLLYLNLKTNKSRLLLRRKIACREASFTPSRHLVVFSGFDDQTQRWQIFTYDFVYDNLNRLTSENGNCNFPVFSPDGKTIAYLVRTGESSRLKTVSWYGEQMNVIASRVQEKACWTPDSWRLLYISKTGNYFVIFSIRNDGTHKEVLFSSRHPLCCPTLSADGRKLFLSMKKNNKFQLITLIKKE